MKNINRVMKGVLHVMEKEMEITKIVKHVQPGPIKKMFVVTGQR